MKDHSAIAISGPQIGVRDPIIVLASGDVLISPMIVDRSDEYIELEETDFRFPGVAVKRERPLWIRVRYTDGNGVVGTSKFVGMTARLIQQHMDVLDGIGFLDNLSEFHRERALKQVKKTLRLRKAIKRLGR